MLQIALKELFTPHFETLTDPRVERTRRHELLHVFILALCGTISGADGWVEIASYAQSKLAFFRRYLDLPHGTPSHDTFGRVFARLDPAALLTCVRSWLDAFRSKVEQELVAIDGKTLRGSFDTAAGQSPLHLVSAWAGEARLVLGQVAVADKSNEITAIPILLELLDLNGAIVTIDAHAVNVGCTIGSSSAPDGSNISDSSASGNGAARLDHAMKPSRSTGPARFASTLPVPHATAAALEPGRVCLRIMMRLSCRRSRCWFRCSAWRAPRLPSASD